MIPAAPEPVPPKKQFYLDTWAERDRGYVLLYLKSRPDAKPDPAEDRCICEWWDEDLSQAFEDGFLSRRDLLGSAIEYAASVGLIRQA